MKDYNFITKDAALENDLRNYGPILYLKVDVSKGDEPKWEYYKISEGSPFVVKLVPSTLRITIVNINSIMWLFNDFWYRRTKYVSKGIYERRFDGVIDKLISYK